MILVNTMHFRPEEEADRIVAPLLALKPVQQMKKTIGFENMTDAAEAFNKQGGFKAQISCGMQKFSARKFEQSLNSFGTLLDENPSTSGSFIMYNYYSPKQMMTRPESSPYSHRDCGVWR
jgi:hypothetical protein